MMCVVKVISLPLWQTAVQPAMAQAQASGSGNSGLGHQDFISVQFLYSQVIIPTVYLSAK
jgi:hypothetical protein